MGASPTKHKPKNIHVKCSSRRSPSTSSSDYSSDCGDSGRSSVDSDNSSNTDVESTNQRAESATPFAADDPESPGKVSGEHRYYSRQENEQNAKSKESNFIETSEFPYARAKLVHPQTSREHQDARSEGRRVEGRPTCPTWTTKPSLPPRPKQQVKHVIFGGHSQSRAERTINPHILWSVHSNGSGINVVPCKEVSRRLSDHMPASTWRNPNRVHTYFRDQNSIATNDLVSSNNDMPQCDGRVVRPPTPCTPANTAMWSSAANSGAVLGYTDEERKALIRAQYKIELEAIRQMTNQYSRMSTTGHR